ncbi:Carboxy-terminal-processing protease [Gammaproteobacteria bacterium]
MFDKRSVYVLGAGVAFGVSLILGHGARAQRDPAPAESLPLDDLRVFSEVFARIKNDYVKPVEDKTLLENAIRGMLAGLDPHSTYLDTDAYKELQVGTSGQFGGLGIEVGMEDGFVKVISPIDDTPASHAGIEAGDLIIRLDDTPVKGMTLTEAVKMMRGKPGTEILLTVVREGQQKPLKIKIKRDIIQVRSVKSRTLETGYGYVRITQFQSQTETNLVEEIDKLKHDNDGKLKGLVIDLRNNPGGILSAAVAVSDAFLDKGVVVYTEGRVKDSQLRFKANPGDLLDGAPIVVVVNGGSASASEIVAGALQDHHRAIVMGQKTFGKGSVQTILPMTGGDTALKLTTALYYTPSGRSIQAEGIQPDIVLENVKLASVADGDVLALKEADLTHHISNAAMDKKIKIKESKDSKEVKEEKETSNKARGVDNNESLTKDFPIYEALNMLKGMTLIQTKTDRN